MSRLKGFAAYDTVTPTVTLAPALQLLCKEHAKLRKGMEEILRFASRATSRSRPLMEEWLIREQKFRKQWNLHTNKEEHALLSALSKYVDSDRGPLAVMKFEHERLEMMFDEFEDKLKQLIEDPSNEECYRDALGRFRMVCQMKGDHCYKEEMVVYTLAQSLLSDAEKALLLQLVRKMKA